MVMTLDKEEHKQFLLELFKQAQFPGHILELAYDVKKAITEATITNGK
jgi:hypothetical protein